MKPVFRVIAAIALFGALLFGVLVLFRAASGWQSQSAQPGQAYPPPTDAGNAPAATPTGEPDLAYPPPNETPSTLPPSYTPGPTAVVYVLGPGEAMPTEFHPTFTPYPTPTQRPGPPPTPIPLVQPAKDAAGTIVYLSRLANRNEEAMIDKALNVIAVDAAGIASSAPTQVTVAAEGGWAPDGVVYPSPDGSCLAIVGEWAVTYVIEVSTGKAEHLLGGKTIEAFWSWYPDSRHVLVSPRMGGLLLYNIYNFDEKVPLAILAYGAIGGAAVSPDGQKVIYYSSDDVSSPAGVWMVNADGREARLLFESGDMWSSAWSPDGKQIALQGGRMVMDADGSNLRELGSFRFCGSPRWSPDSRTLALVVSTWDGTSSCYDWNDDVLKAADILLVDVESGKNRPLLADGSAGNIDPAWSPDGQQIVFVSNRSGATEVWAVDADGTNLRQLTSDGQYKRYPFWRRP